MEEHPGTPGPGPNPRALEAALARLVGVEAARVCLAGGAISEVHIAASPGSRPKNVARDVRSYLAAVHGIEVDHKRISIAVERCAPGEARPEGREEVYPRVAFVGCEVRAEAGRVEFCVRLEAGGRVLQGRATGIAAQPIERLAAEAALAALQPVVCPEVMLALGEVRRVRLGAGEVALVEVLVQQGCASERMIAACGLEGDPGPAAARAVLAALDRRLTALIAPPWTEIQVEAEPELPPEGGIA